MLVQALQRLFIAFLPGESEMMNMTIEKKTDNLQMNHLAYLKQVKRETKSLIRKVKKAEKKDLTTQKRIFAHAIEQRNSLLKQLNELESQIIELDKSMNDCITHEQIMQELHNAETKTE